MSVAELTGGNPGFSLTEYADDLFVGKTLIHGDALTLLMKTLRTSRCINQRQAGHFPCKYLNSSLADLGETLFQGNFNLKFKYFKHKNHIFRLKKSLGNFFTGYDFATRHRKRTTTSASAALWPILYEI
jgi:hypothetical protein